MRLVRVGPERLAELFDTHAGALVLYARTWCDRPEDAVQDAFLAQAREPDPVLPWLYRVARNAALMAARSDRRRRRREGRASEPEHAPDPWFETADDRLDARRAAVLLAELAPDAREVVVGRLWGGL